MKDILTAPFLREFCQTASNMYRLGWDERNGGNISMLLDEAELNEYLDTASVLRTIPTGFDTASLRGKCFLVTGTGKYFKNIEADPETNLGILRIARDGASAELLWGLRDGGNPTSEFASHMMTHAVRLQVDPEHRVVTHCHPTHTLAMTFVHELEDKTFSHSLWQMCSECIMVFPDGVVCCRGWSAAQMPSARRLLKKCVTFVSSSGACTAFTAPAERWMRLSG